MQTSDRNSFIKGREFIVILRTERPSNGNATSTSSSTSTIVGSLFGVIVTIALAVGGYFLYKRKFRENENSKEQRKEETVTDYDDKTYGGKDVYDNENEYYAAQENYYDNSKDYYYS